MPKLSPAAQTVLSAYHEEAMDYIEEWGSFRHKRGMAAALRAAADQVAPEPDDWDKDNFSIQALRLRCVMRDQILAIAAELEAQ